MFNYLAQLAAEVHVDNDHWWRDPKTGKRIERNKSQTLFLICSEIVEAGEGERKDLMDDHIPTRKMAEVELADALIRFLDYVGAHKYDLDARMRVSFPSCADKTLSGLCAFFNQRFYRPGDNKAEQLMQMIMTASRVAELEIGGSPVRDIESQLLWLLGLICDYCGCWGYDLQGAVAEKRGYNKVRADHKNEARLAAGGKQW